MKKKVYRFYENLSDKELLEYTALNHNGKLVEEMRSNEISLYNILIKRKLIDDLVKKEVIKRKARSIWPDFKTWKKEGLKRKYNAVSPGDLFAGNINQRAWYQRGRKQGWIRDFIFYNRKYQKSSVTFNNLIEWKDFGIKNNYSSIALRQLAFGSSVEQRSWYSKGRREGWLTRFPFSRCKETSTKELSSLLENYAGVNND